MKKISLNYWNTLTENEKSFFNKFVQTNDIPYLKSVVSLGRKLFPNKQIELFPNRFEVDGQKHFFSMESKKIVFVK